MRWNKEKLYTFFDRNFYGLSRSSQGWYNCECPTCGKQKLAVNFKYMQVKCWTGCYSKQYIPDFVKKYLGTSYYDAVAAVEDEEISSVKVPKLISRVRKEEGLTLPPGYSPILSYSGSSIGLSAYKYLERRGFDMNYLDMQGVGYCDQESKDFKDNYFGYIIIPFKRQGKLVYFIGRDFTGNFLRYKNPDRETFGVGKADVLFNADALQMHEIVFITEGWADAATIGRRGISTQGLDFSTKQVNEIVSSPVKEVVIIPDAGAYKEGLKNARKLLDHKKVRVVSLDKFKDSDQGKDINEIGWDKVKSTIYDHPILTKYSWYKAMRKA